MKRSPPDPTYLRNEERATFERGGVADDDLCYLDAIKCPYCGHEQQDIFEIDGAYEDGDFEADCGLCGGTFEFSTSVSYNYSMRRVAPGEKK